MGNKTIWLPENSALIIVKFNDETQQNESLKDPEFKKIIGDLSTYALSKKIEIRLKTNP